MPFTATLVPDGPDGSDDGVSSNTHTVSYSPNQQRMFDPNQPMTLQRAQIAEDAGNQTAAQIIKQSAGDYTHLGQQFHDPYGGTE